MSITQNSRLLTDSKFGGSNDALQNTMKANVNISPRCRRWDVCEREREVRRINQYTDISAPLILTLLTANVLLHSWYCKILSHGYTYSLLSNPWAHSSAFIILKSSVVFRVLCQLSSAVVRILYFLYYFILYKRCFEHLLLKNAKYTNLV